jgi:hypothetical protein
MYSGPQPISVSYYFQPNNQNNYSNRASPYFRQAYPIQNFNNAAVNIYEQMNIQREILLQQAQEYRLKMLEKNYPVNFVIGHGILLGLICVVIFVLQIVMIVNKYPLYYVGSGIWVSGSFFDIKIAVLINC